MSTTTSLPESLPESLRDMPDWDSGAPSPWTPEYRRDVDDDALEPLLNAAHQPADVRQPVRVARRVHHLNCATLCPLGGDLVNESHRLVCHCLLVETDAGLVLVDTGLGLDAVARPREGTTAPFRRLLRPRLDPEETAVRQIERLGFRREDVQHIVLTHLDLDHAGGLRDFPAATVHVFEKEHAAALSPQGYFARERYRAIHWSHDVRWQLHSLRGERWYGFECVRDLPGLPPEILLVPLLGHTHGHCGVAVDIGGRWIFHCGDAYFHRDEIHPLAPDCPPGLAVFQRIVSVDEPLRRRNQERLRELARGVGVEGMHVFCAHDPEEFELMREHSASPALPSKPRTVPADADLALGGVPPTVAEPTPSGSSSDATGPPSVPAPEPAAEADGSSTETLPPTTPV